MDDSETDLANKLPKDWNEERKKAALAGKLDASWAKTGRMKDGRPEDTSWRHEPKGQVNQPSKKTKESSDKSTELEGPRKASAARELKASTLATIDDEWLPEGHLSSWDLHIEHRPLEDGGAISSGGNKFIVHTTESDWDDLEAMYGVLRDKRAAPHLLIGGMNNREHPTVIQMIPFGRAGRALEHPAGTPPTNGAGNSPQIEICWRAANSQNMSDWMIKALANLFVLVQHRVNIPIKAPQDFSNPVRMSAQSWITASGIVGHSMVPNNTHWDPGRFREGTFINYINKVIEDGPFAL
jgi:hypothetical protein